jgi:hypothetical protein
MKKTKTKKPYEPSNAKIHLEINKDDIEIRLDGNSDDLIFLLATTIEQYPSFAHVLKMTLAFGEYMENKASEN